MIKISFLLINHNIYNMNDMDVIDEIDILNEIINIYLLYSYIIGWQFSSICIIKKAIIYESRIRCRKKTLSSCC